jgi:hypothetical protein
MNDSLHYVKPIMSLDATHLKSGSKGVLYLATVKTGLNELYPVAIAIERANEGYDGWIIFLLYLKNACPLMIQNTIQHQPIKFMVISLLFQTEIKVWYNHCKKIFLSIIQLNVAFISNVM